MAPRIRLAYFSIRRRRPIIGEWCAVRSTSNWEVGLVPRPMCFTGSGYNFPLLISRELLIWRFWSCWQWACRISLLYQCILLHNSSFPSASLEKKQIVKWSCQASWFFTWPWMHYPCSCKWLCCQLSKHRLGQFGKFSEADIFTCWFLWKM